MLDKTAFIFVAGAVLLGGQGIPRGISQAFAQGNPSADSIVNQLRPGAGFGGATRGIRPLAPQPAPSAVPSPASNLAAHAGAISGNAARVAPTPTLPPVAAPRLAAEAPPSVDLSVQFATNSATLTPAAMRTLDELGRALSSATLATYHFRIEGHTDTVGNAEHNQVLSEARAKAVVAYLVTKFAVDPARLEPVGMGQTHLVVPTGDNVPEARNRRVSVINTGA